MSKLTVSIGAKDFDITLDDEFSKFFEKEFVETFCNKKNIETKELLWAYVQKSYDAYLDKKELSKIFEKLEKG